MRDIHGAHHHAPIVTISPSVRSDRQKASRSFRPGLANGKSTLKCQLLQITNASQPADLLIAVTEVNSLFPKGAD
jgi:hypothetical protein